MEVLLIDDGSTDLSSKICDEYFKRDRRFYVYHKENGGVSSARNLGLEKAHGKWIVFVDADDKPTDKLLANVPEEQDELVCYNWQYTTGESENEQLHDSIYAGEEKQDFLSQHLADFIFRTPWAKMFRRSIISNYNIRFDERFRLGEDNLFVLDYLAHCGRIITMRDLGYIYLRPSLSKYSLPLSYSISYMTTFMQKYKTVNVNCQPLLLLLEYYYFMKIGDDSFRVRLQWERCRAVREVMSICWKRYSLKEKIKIVFRRICGNILYGKD